MSKILLEGGNVWPDVTPFDHLYIPDILKTVNVALAGTGIKVLPVGSAATPTPGKVSGDMDVIVDEASVLEFFNVPDAKTGRKSLAEYLHNKGFDVSQSGINVHVKVPVGTAFHQVDIMVTPNAKRVALFHTHNIPKGSPYKGVNKQLIMAMIAKERGLMWSAWQGLFNRDAKGKKGEFITDDMDKIAQLLLGAGATAKDLGSVESILAKLPKDTAQALLDRASQDPNWAVVKESKMKKVKEGVFNRIANRIMGVAPEQPVYKVGQRVRYHTYPAQPEWADGGSGEGVITDYQNGHYMINGYPINHHEIKKVLGEEQPVMEARDTVTMDVPLLIRLLEYSREDAKTDMDLHRVTERLIELGQGGKVLSMDHYNSIVSNQAKVAPAKPAAKPAVTGDKFWYTTVEYGPHQAYDLKVRAPDKKTAHKKAAAWAKKRGVQYPSISVQYEMTTDRPVTAEVDESKAEKQRLDPKCWNGYRKEGTKVKGGVRVNNCVPVKEDEGGATAPREHHGKPTKHFKPDAYYIVDSHTGEVEAGPYKDMASARRDLSGHTSAMSGAALNARGAKPIARGATNESEMLEETLLGNSFHEKYGWIKYEPESLMEAEYQGRKVQLNKPMKGDVAKFKVYVKDPSTGNVKKVNFGDPNMTIKKHIPGRRKSFRARHNCDNPGPKTKARYWSCKAW